MAFALCGARLLLAVVFLSAAAGKLRDRIGFQKTLTAFGVPAVVAGPAGTLIPGAELAAAILLVPATSAWWGATASFALLVVFTAAAAVNLARGWTPACRCFGSTTSEPIGPATIARNTALAACALSVIVAGPGVPLDRLTTEWGGATADERLLSIVSLIVLAALITTNWYATRLRSTNARLVDRVRFLEQELTAAVAAPAGESVGLPRGTPAPPFDFVRLEGDRVSLETLTQAGLPVLLIFSDAHCSACAQLWPDIGRWQQRYADTLTIAVICGGPSQLIEMKLIGINVTNVLLAGDIKLGDAYSLPLTPSAIVVSPDGRIASDGAAGVPAIRSLVARTGGS